MIADKDDEWKEEMLQNVLLGATFQSSNIESYRKTMLNLYKVMQKINPASAQEGKDLAEYYFREHGKDFPLELPSKKMFEQMSEIAALRQSSLLELLKSLKRDLFSLVGWLKRWKNKHQSFKRITLEITRELWVTT